MPIPPFDENGLLPVGIHDCTVEEIKARFGSFQESDRRPQLFSKFQLLVTEARAAQFARSLLVDGSFVTAMPEPNDIDLVLVLPPTHDLAADLLPMQYNLVSKRRVQRRYGFDMVPCVRTHWNTTRPWLSFGRCDTNQPCTKAF